MEKQNEVARSSIKSKLRAIVQELCDLLWLQIILDNLQIK